MANLRYPTKNTKFLAGELVNVDNPIPKDYSGLVSTIDLETKWDDHGIVHPKSLGPRRSTGAGSGASPSSWAAPRRPASFGCCAARSSRRTPFIPPKRWESPGTSREKSAKHGKWSKKHVKPCFLLENLGHFEEILENSGKMMEQLWETRKSHSFGKWFSL